MYKVYCASGKLVNWFRGEELFDMKTVVFPSLNATDASKLVEITLIQASRAVHWMAEQCQLMQEHPQSVNAKGTVKLTDAAAKKLVSTAVQNASDRKCKNVP